MDLFNSINIKSYVGIFIIVFSILLKISIYLHKKVSVFDRDYDDYVDMAEHIYKYRKAHELLKYIKKYTNYRPQPPDLAQKLIEGKALANEVQNDWCYGEVKIWGFKTGIFLIYVKILKFRTKYINIFLIHMILGQLIFILSLFISYMIYCYYYNKNINSIML